MTAGVRSRLTQRGVQKNDTAKRCQRDRAGIQPSGSHRFCPLAARGARPMPSRVWLC